MAANDVRVKKFTEGAPAGVAKVTRDGGGTLTSWVENGFSVTVRQNDDGRPVAVTARRGGMRLNMIFEFDDGGRLKELSGDVFPTVFMPELCGLVGSAGGVNPGALSLLMP